MASPFPGMDPYLEDDKLWSEFQHHLVLCLYQLLLPGLVDRYRARVGQRHYCTEQALFTSVLREEHQEEYIEVRQRTDGRLVTLLDCVSPTNKTTPVGREAYLNKRREGRSAGANLVELDLVLQGQPTFVYTHHNHHEWDYAVVVTRSNQPDHPEIYPVTLRKRLPRFRLPLGHDDHDTVLDLHATFARCYDQSGVAARIDYRRDPSAVVKDEDRQWLDKLLRVQKLR